MPFGGVKDSGWGRFGGAAALDEFSELKWVTVTSGSHPYPFYVPTWTLEGLDR